MDCYASVNIFWVWAVGVFSCWQKGAGLWVLVFGTFGYWRFSLLAENPRLKAFNF